MGILVRGASKRRHAMLFLGEGQKGLLMQEGHLSTHPKTEKHQAIAWTVFTLDLQRRHHFTSE